MRHQQGVGVWDLIDKVGKSESPHAAFYPPLARQSKLKNSNRIGVTRILVGAVSALFVLTGVGIALLYTDSADSPAQPFGSMVAGDAGPDLNENSLTIKPAAAAVLPTAMSNPAVSSNPVVPTATDSAATSVGPTEPSATPEYSPETVAAAPAEPAPVPATLIPAPEFTIPPIIPDPSKSEQQLQDEAWARHWQQTDAWIEQQLQQH